MPRIFDNIEQSLLPALQETLALSDRVFAMARGRLTAVPDESKTREGIGALMLVGDVGGA